MGAYLTDGMCVRECFGFCRRFPELIGEPFCAWQDYDERQPPGWPEWLSMRWEQRVKGVIRGQGIQFIGKLQITVPVGKNDTGGTQCIVWHWLDEHRAEHGEPPRMCV